VVRGDGPPAEANRRRLPRTEAGGERLLQQDLGTCRVRDDTRARRERKAARPGGRSPGQLFQHVADGSFFEILRAADYQLRVTRSALGASDIGPERLRQLRALKILEQTGPQVTFGIKIFTNRSPLAGSRSMA